MSDDFTFVPWAREGLANSINAAGALRASVPVQLRLTARELDGAEVPHDLPARNVELYGPGDVIGIDSRAVIRTEPRSEVTNFEPNYLAAIEFYDEDFPWRYTPATPTAADSRLSPWIVLIVLKEEKEFEEGGDVRNRPLTFITLINNALQTAFPNPDHLWAWAHVHANRSLTAENEIVALDRNEVAQRLDDVVKENADLAYSRIVCPRRLEANTTYHAVLLPAFESGRLAGLGLDPTQTPAANANAWSSNGEEQNNFPVYYRWRFRTGEVGDFEYLVRLLKPRQADKRVGTRELDVQQPGSNLPGIADPNLRGVLQLGGALRVPRDSLSPADQAIAEQQDKWAQPYPHQFQQGLASLINLSDSYATQTAAQANAAAGVQDLAGDPDPAITPPLYGRWHARTPRLLTNRSGGALPNSRNWVHELNLDPRFRVSAGFGTRVVQNKQEELMAAAWEQVGDVLEANRRTRRLKFAQQVALVWHRSHLVELARDNAAKAIALTAPVHSRIMAGIAPAVQTVKAHVSASNIPSVLVGPTFRRLIRPRAPILRKLPFNDRLRPDDLLARVNRNEVLPAPPKLTPPGVVTVKDVAEAALPQNVPPWLIDLLRRSPIVVFLPLIIGFILALILWLFGIGLPIAISIFVAGLAITLVLAAIRRQVRKADGLGEGEQTPADIDELPRSPDFSFTDPFTPSGPVTLSPSGADSADATRFKVALKDLHALTAATIVADTVGENGPARFPLDIDDNVQVLLRGVDPAITIPRWATSVIRLPPRIRNEAPEEFVEAMAYPVFDIPMYRPLADLSSELLIPNLNLIENNSVTLLETNQEFIEAYMVGLNHEFARELLWREYPTDQRGSYFRQFWDVSSFFPRGPVDEQLRERFRDIPRLHDWSLRSRLGEHDARERPGENQEEIVLVIRGDLLKRYPNAVIYAQAAEWPRQQNGDIDLTRERSLVNITAAEENNPPREKLRTPLYMAKIEPDLYFLGFDLTEVEARGGTGQNRQDPAGWFFVLKERPGEPRFGFDEESQPQIVVWNDLGWDRVPTAGNFIQPLPGIAGMIDIPPNVPVDQQEKEEQRADDVHVSWNDDTSSAELAYILYQAPVMVAIHAGEMLRPT
ncbi:MAG TPA: hypothetical protein VF088_02990 [Pyrinomonadaceae bacterium]